MISTSIGKVHQAAKGTALRESVIGH